MTYYSAINLPPRIPTPKGSRISPVYSLVENKETGERTVQRTGDHDLYAEVQECRKSCDIRELIKRFENGDDKAFDLKQGFFADFSDLSGLTLSEVNSKIGDLRTYFNSAPLEVRAAFDNNFDVYVKRMGVMPVEKKEPAQEPAEKEVE